jgi:AcrR family transcriptional regulator
MPQKATVDKLLAESFKELVAVTPVEKITIKEITDKAGVIRPTFYNHFQDKYDLINWYFDKILIESFHQMGEGSTVYESLVKKFEYIRMEQLFFKAAFKNDEQNKEHDFELIRQFYIDQIEGKSHRKISDKLLFQLEMYCQGSVFMTTQWVLGNKNFTPQELAGLLADAMPKELADVFREVNLI